MDIAVFIAGIGGFAWTIAAFVIALSVVVAVHEYGHYIVGRWSGIQADVFSVGFGPVVWSRMDKRGTKWQIAAYPFGGYVKFAGDANAASAPDASVPKERHTMTGAPLWARTLTVAAGPFFNFVLAAILFCVLIMARGQASEPLTIAQIAPLPAAEQGLQVGDQILGINGQDAESLRAIGALIDDLPQVDTLDYRVLRDGQEITVPGPFPFPPLAESVTPNSASDDAGVMPGDVITAIDGTPIVAFDQLLQTTKASEGRTLAVTVWRDGQELSFDLTPRRVDLPLSDGSFDTRWMIGIGGSFFFEPAVDRVPVTDAIWAGVRQTVFILRSTINGIGAIVTGAISTCNISGPIGIAEAAGDTAQQGLESFINFIAVISAAVGFMNLIPIPILDGGHLVFYAYEAVFRRQPSARALNVLMTVGFAVLGALMLFAVTNDLFCP